MVGLRPVLQGKTLVWHHYQGQEPVVIQSIRPKGGPTLAILLS